VSRLISPLGPRALRPGRAVDVTIIGGGAIGACAALELARAGASVVVLERGAGLASGCSAGNAGIVGAGHVAPLADPAAMRDGLKWMTRRDSPFYARPHPRVLSWMARFAAATTPGRFRRAGALLGDLAARSAAMHAALDDAGLDAGYARRGMLNLFESERAFAAAREDTADDPHAQIVAPDELASLLPLLTGSYAGAILQRDEAHCDPLRFVRSIAAAATELGVEFRTGVEVLDIRRRGDRIDDLWTTAGTLRTAEVVVAAGVWTRALARQLGARLPLEAGKGYHVDVASHDGDPGLPVWLHEHRVVITPLDGRIRMAGTLELTADDHGVSSRRVEAIVAATRGALPAIAARPALDVWRGLRPCTPDGLPIIGRPAAISNAILATGHGMWGLQLAPLTGRLVGQIATGEAPEHDITRLGPDRFSLRARPSTAVPPARAERGIGDEPVAEEALAVR
jgi:D-amino-acid dehydrogenase